MFAPPSVASVINASVAAHRGMRVFRAHVELDAVVSGEHKHTTYDVATDGMTAVLRVRKPEKGEEAASDRTLYFGATRLIGYDAAANERLSRVLPKGKSVLDRVIFVLGPPDDMIKNLLDPSAMETFLLSMRKLYNWHYQAGADGPTVIRSIPGNVTKLSFTPGRSLLRRVDVSSSGNEIHWKFDYSRGGPAPLTLPASARLVGAFTVSLVPPKYASPEARRITRSVIEAYRNLKRGEIVVDGDDGHVEIFLTDRKLRENQAHLVYAYDGKRLTILGGAKDAFYAGAAVRSAIPDYIADVGGRADPLSRQILQRKVPFQEVFAPRSTVTLSGQTKVDSQTCDILKIEFAGGRVSMFVRRSDHLIDSVSTDTLDSNGHLLTSSARRFRYMMLGVSQPDYRFIVTRRAGQPKLPLPPLKLGS